MCMCVCGGGCVLLCLILKHIFFLLNGISIYEKENKKKEKIPHVTLNSELGVA